MTNKLQKEFTTDVADAVANVAEEYGIANDEMLVDIDGVHALVSIQGCLESDQEETPEPVELVMKIGPEVSLQGDGGGHDIVGQVASEEIDIRPHFTVPLPDDIVSDADRPKPCDRPELPLEPVTNLDELEERVDQLQAIRED